MFARMYGHDKAKRVAIVDVGSSSAAVGILEIHPNKKSTLLAAQRSFIPYEKRTAEQFAARMGSAIEEAAQKAMLSLSAKKDARPGKLHDLYVFFRAPWVDAQVVRLTKHFDTETK